MNQNSDGAFTAATQPFTTQDAILAFSLHMAGVPFEDPTQPCINLYDAEMLRKLGFRGMKIEDAAREAQRTKKRGQVQYILKRTPQFNDLLQAFTDEQAGSAKREGTAADRVREIADSDVSAEEKLLRIGCVLLKMRVKFMELWQSQVPLIRIPDDGQPETVETPDGRVTKFPNFKVISVNMSASKRKEMGLSR